ncbi:MAG: PilX N-terminal domain-containing pilus assembly protein [bacterium]
MSRKNRKNFLITKQRGVAALVTTVVLLLVITLITLYTANTMVFEQKVSANFYRSQQALVAAQAGLDEAIKHFNEYNEADASPNTPGTFVDDLVYTDGGYDVTFCSVSTDAALTTFLDDPENCTALNSFAISAADWTRTDGDPSVERYQIGIVSVGKGDDETSRRVVSTLAAGGPILNSGGSPAQPITAVGTVAITGNITVFNRYLNANVWSGGTTGTGSNSVESYINDGTLETDRSDPSYSRADLTDSSYPSTNNALLSSKADLGLNADVIDGDPNLANLSEDQLFEAFFAGSQTEIRAIAEGGGQLFTDIDDASGKSGLIWVEGSASYGPFGNDVGAVDGSAFLVVDGDLTMNGGVFYGLLFVIGDVTLGGNVEIYGALVATGNVDKSGGTPVIVYDPDALGNPPLGPAGGRGLVAGTWRDWGS